MYLFALKKWDEEIFEEAVDLWNGVFLPLCRDQPFCDSRFLPCAYSSFFSKPELINILSGIAEILLGLGVLYFPTRRRAAWGIFVMLICFIPSHVYFIQVGSCIEGGLCVPEWLGWIRLLLFNPILLYWAFWVSKIDSLEN